MDEDTARDIESKAEKARQQGDRTMRGLLIVKIVNLIVKQQSNVSRNDTSKGSTRNDHSDTDVKSDQEGNKLKQARGGFMRSMTSAVSGVTSHTSSPSKTPKDIECYMKLSLGHQHHKSSTVK